MTKILISYRAAPNIRGWETGALLASALRELDCEVYEYAKVYECNTYINTQPHVKHLLDERFLTAGDLRKLEYDLHIFMECNDPEHQYTELLSVDARKRVAWFFDTSYYPGHISNLCSLMKFDWVFSANPIYERNFFGLNSSFLPYAIDPSKHIRPLDTVKSSKITLVGSNRKERRDLIDKLRLSNVFAELISDVFKENYVATLAQSKIIVNENPLAGRGLLNMRTFEAPAAGCLLFAPAGDFVSRVFTPGLEVIEYNSLEGLTGYCKALSGSDIAYMAMRSQERVLEDHTYKNRAEEILNVCL